MVVYILITAVVLGSALFYQYFNKFGSKVITPMRADQKKYLSDFSYYYRQLPSKDKEEFERRVMMFVFSKNWHTGVDMKAINENQMIAIGSYAVQITFGLGVNTFGKFKTIVLYNDVYTSQYTGKKHKGEVNKFGAIVLSWKHFEAGVKDHSDGVNLALHEMAHAFFINNFSAQKFGGMQVQRKLFDQLHQISQQVIVKIKQGKVKCMRDYATTNFQEFFACTMETFFEKPFEMRTELPELYKCMCNILRQDPTMLYNKR
jgi:MtfA peptidase